MHVGKRKISPRVMISVVSQYVIGFTCHNESMLIGLFRQRQFGDEWKWLFVSADVRGAGRRDEPLRTSAWEARSNWLDQRRLDQIGSKEIKGSN